MDAICTRRPAIIRHYGSMSFLHNSWRASAVLSKRGKQRRAYGVNQNVA